MPNLHANFLKGQVSVLASAGATTLTSPAFTSLPVVAGSDRVLLTLDPEGSAGPPEVVEVTAHSSAATTATVVRGRLATAAREHAVGTPWVHAFYAQEFDTALSDVASKVSKAGDTMTGALTLPGAPTSGLHAASKAYVDATAATAQGGAWTSWTPVVTYKPLVGSEVTCGVTIRSARWQQIGKLVDAFATVSFSGSPAPPTFSANGKMLITLPTPCRSDAVDYGTLGTAGVWDQNLPSGATWINGVVVPTSTTKVQVMLPGLSGSGGGPWGSHTSYQATANDTVGLSLRYEAP